MALYCDGRSAAGGMRVGSVGGVDLMSSLTARAAAPAGTSRVAGAPSTGSSSTPDDAAAGDLNDAAGKRDSGGGGATPGEGERGDAAEASWDMTAGGEDDGGARPNRAGSSRSARWHRNCAMM